MNQTEIATERLVLRKFELSDAKQVQALAGSKEVSSTTANIPYPYPDGLAEKWILNHPVNFANNLVITYAVTLKAENRLVGCVSMMNLSTEKPELGYWFGVEFWGKGYCTEACLALINFCTQNYELNAIYGKHLTRNPASGKVMEKCGLSYIESDIGKDGFMEKPEEFKVYRKVYA